jgi:hypothetical protein
MLSAVEPMPKVVKDDRRLADFDVVSDHFLGKVLLVFLVIQTGEPGCQTLDGNLELGIEVDERTQLIREPGKRHFFFTPPCLELLDTPISEIHELTRQAKAASSRARCCCR